MTAYRVQGKQIKGILVLNIIFYLLVSYREKKKQTIKLMHS